MIVQSNKKKSLWCRWRKGTVSHSELQPTRSSAWIIQTILQTLELKRPALLQLFSQQPM